VFLTYRQTTSLGFNSVVRQRRIIDRSTVLVFLSAGMMASVGPSSSPPILKLALCCDCCATRLLCSCCSSSWWWWFARHSDANVLTHSTANPSSSQPHHQYAKAHIFVGGSVGIVSSKSPLWFPLLHRSVPKKRIPTQHRSSCFCNEIVLGRQTRICTIP
jgi:hypothetical protein